MPANHSPQPASRTTITRILRQARRRIDPRDIPGATAILGPQSSPGLTQDAVAQLLGVSTKWYRNLELGKPLTFSKAMLEGVRRLLALTEDEWETVWQLTYGRPASDTSADDPPAGARQPPPPVVKQFIESQPWPTYLRDHHWEVSIFNRAAGRDFPWMLYGTNVAVWVLTYPEARTQLIRWEEDWAIPMIAELRLEAERRSNDIGLQAIIRTVQSDPVARRLWDLPNLPAVSHPSAKHPRTLYLPRQGAKAFEISVLTMRVDDMPSYRLTVIIPAHDKPSASQLTRAATPRTAGAKRPS
ncbi:helix-turn-helix domain-containing protein [Streptomyces sp. NPDC001508]|uniref:MmyB family transcriptional regulator n=1 Tax=Streptomyces sp. NPDC001508 TaxID=3154656 RepID=UPI0033189BD2